MFSDNPKDYLPGPVEVPKRTGPKKLFDLKSYIKNVLRRASYRHSARSEALRKARIERNTYVCAACKETFPNKEVNVDHINCVVPVTGFTTWDEYIARLFCGVDGLQILCDVDHKIKTQKENAERREHKKGQHDRY